MNLLIKIQDGKPIDHPIAEENLRFFYPDLDIENPPDGYAKFVRKPYPELEKFQKLESIEYVPDPDYWPSNIPVYTDKFNIRELTEEEMIELANQEAKLINKQMEIYSNAPYPAPDDGNLYIWSGTSNQWVLKPYNFDSVFSEYYQKIKEFGLSEIPPEQFDNIDADKKQQLQQIIDKLNY